MLPNAKQLWPIGPRLLPSIYGSQDTSETWSPREFYQSVYVPLRNHLNSILPQSDQLKCQLYPFQRRAVQWLLQREGVGLPDKQIITHDSNQAVGRLPYDFVEISDNGRESWFSPLMGIMTTDKRLLHDTGLDIRGGILAEEMGLGKTVEIVALICLHRMTRARSIQETQPTSLQLCGATLIVTPSSIIQQWKSEIQTLAPHLRVTTYEGLKVEAAGSDNGQLLAHFSRQDVILTTYNVLAREVHHSGHLPDRDLRHSKKFERRLSPLIQLNWWRVVLDEAQMMESGVSNAATVAQLIPRQNAWAVSGTPLRKDATDLLGLLIFLRCWPYCQSPILWDRIIKYHKDIFRDIFGTLALRHTKEFVRDDMDLPVQKRILITIPFTQIEDQHYSTLFQEMCDDCGFDINGRPMEEASDMNSTKNIEKMRTWLARLRQTVLHPSVGVRNRRALGLGKGPLRTVREVLKLMREQNETACRGEERALLMSQARRGQLLEHAQRSGEALEIWLQTLKESAVIVKDCRLRFNSDWDNLKTPSHIAESARVCSQEAAGAARSSVLRQRLRGALEVEHMCTFFAANAYYQIKTGEALTNPNSESIKALQALEENSYDQAQRIRKELLVEIRTKALSSMEVINGKAQNHSFVEIPRLVSLGEYAGIESRNIIARFDNLLTIAERQAGQIDEWRETTIKLLLIPLVDDEKNELQGDEYETSTRNQDEVYVYVDALRAILADRHSVLAGLVNTRVEHEIKYALDQADKGTGHSPGLLKKLLSIRHALKPSPDLGSVRGGITQLRELKSTLRAQMPEASGRVSSELTIVDVLLHKAHNIAKEQRKALDLLDRELELFKDTMNLRLDYYRQLQQISDTVAPYEEDLDERSLYTLMAGMKDTERQMHARIATYKSKARYLSHLRDEASNMDAQRLCTICQQFFEMGVLTSCGHTYCLECLQLWWKSCTTKNCPTCKKYLSRDDINHIT